MLRAHPGLSHKVLNQRLAKLLRLSLITRTEVSAKPLHVVYGLSCFGRDIGRVHEVVAAVQREWENSSQAGA
ncbi:MAG: hypothetical protein EA402_07860 [Planctomycetota bacterium]|nr:MAG: hypothetical protein EA402_07860 [Planctomycetota bacterium]